MMVVCQAGIQMSLWLLSCEEDGPSRRCTGPNRSGRACSRTPGISPADGFANTRVSYLTREERLTTYVKEASRNQAMPKPASCQTLCDSCAMDLLAEGRDTRTVRELLGHKELTTTMTYQDVLNVGSRPYRLAGPGDEPFGDYYGRYGRGADSNRLQATAAVVRSVPRPQSVRNQVYMFAILIREGCRPRTQGN